MNQPEVTIVISPRERFSYTRESLESIYQNTNYPFALIYVDGGSPVHIQRYLEAQSQLRKFKLIRRDNYLSPNRARNIALKKVKTEYVVFLDNDVYVEPGWLESLVKCASETEATIVSPLTCIGQKLKDKIHLAGGEARIVLAEKNGKLRRKVHEKHYFVNRSLGEVQGQLQRKQCEFAEFHCMLVRTSIFQEIGLLDKKLLNTREHIDFCLTVTQAGGKIYCEPSSIITYVPGPPFEWSDLPYFMLRWSDEWEMRSLKHFRKKWNLTDKDKYFKKRYKRLGHRRHQAWLKPLIRRFGGGNPLPWLEKILLPVERKINNYITYLYGQKQNIAKDKNKILAPDKVENFTMSKP